MLIHLFPYLHTWYPKLNPQQKLWKWKYVQPHVLSFFAAAFFLIVSVYLDCKLTEAEILASL